MNDSPSGIVDNPSRPDISSRGIHSTPLPDMERPGKRTHSTPLNHEKMIDLQEEKSKGDELIMRALRDSLNNNQNGGRPDADRIAPHLEKKIEPKKPVVTNISTKNNPALQQGFLMPFVNGFNNIIEGVWNALKSLVPMKPQTGAS